LDSYSNEELLKVVENEPRISHRVIAKHTANKPQNVKELIDDYKEKFELFGVIRFETEKGKGRPTVTYFLNEPQATLLLTFMRNNEIVTEFKVNLVKAFYEMRMKIQTKPEHKKVSPQKKFGNCSNWNRTFKISFGFKSCGTN
jgi:phage regulator Rha-like protein